jgi:sucrose phosphorylase
VGRDINRHFYTHDEVLAALQNPMVQRLIEIVRLRNTHPAFCGGPCVESSAANLLSITWQRGEAWAKLSVDFAQPSAAIEYSTDEPGQSRTIQIG